jgi:hypothetical protein
LKRITSLLNFMKICKAVQKLFMEDTQRDRWTGNLNLNNFRMIEAMGL